jgi:hypothetical protein
MWPYIIADKLGCEVVNTAKSGSGNLMIFNRLIKSIMKHLGDIKYVYVMWSDWDRDTIVNNAWGVAINNQNEVIDSNLNIIFATQSILQQLKIPFTMASISEPIINKSTILSDTRSTIKFNELEYYKYINVHPIFDLIDDKSYWGWPVGKYLGGHNVKSFLKDKMGDRYKISKDDAHPNAKGHELIAKELHDHNML